MKFYIYTDGPHTHTSALKQNLDTVLQANLHRGFHTHTEALTHSSNIHTDAFCTQTAFPNARMLVHRCFHIHTHTHSGSFTRRNFYTPALSHTVTFTHRSFYTHTLDKNGSLYDPAGTESCNVQIGWETN